MAMEETVTDSNTRGSMNSWGTASGARRSGLEQESSWRPGSITGPRDDEDLRSRSSSRLM